MFFFEQHLAITATDAAFLSNQVAFLIHQVASLVLKHGLRFLEKAFPFEHLQNAHHIKNVEADSIVVVQGRHQTAFKLGSVKHGLSIVLDQISLFANQKALQINFPVF